MQAFMDAGNRVCDFIIPPEHVVYRKAVPYGLTSLGVAGGAMYLFMASSTVPSTALLVTACALAFLAVSIFVGAVSCALKFSNDLPGFNSYINAAIVTTFTGFCVNAVRTVTEIVVREFAYSITDRLFGRPRYRH